MSCKADNSLVLVPDSRVRRNRYVSRARQNEETSSRALCTGVPRAVQALLAGSRSAQFLAIMVHRFHCQS